MMIVNMYDAKTNLSKLARLLEEGKEDAIIIARNNKPLLRITLEKEIDTSKRIGSAKGLFTIPEDFDELDVEEYFPEEYRL